MAERSEGRTKKKDSFFCRNELGAEKRGLLVWVNYGENRSCWREREREGKK